VNELRWVLLILGVLFLVALFLWERRKQRSSLPRRELAGPDPDTESSSWSGVTRREPSLVLPEMRAREPAQPLPLVELPDDGNFDSRFAGVAEAGPLRRERPPRSEPTFEELPASDGYANGDVSFIEEASGTHNGHAAPDAPPPAFDAASDEAVAEIASPRPETTALRLEWSEEPDRQIIAARVVPLADRFVGRAVRQALAGEGFVHGPLGIFHRALPDGRVVISCASLTKPGSFDLPSMDSQRHAGLNLFGVLPGPLPGSSAVENLVTVARTLASRLGGVVQDDRGQPLDSTRFARMKASISPAAAGEHAP